MQTIAMVKKPASIKYKLIDFPKIQNILDGITGDDVETAILQISLLLTWLIYSRPG